MPTDLYGDISQLTPIQQQQMVVDQLRRSQRRTMAPSPAAFTGLLASDRGLNRVGAALQRQVTDTSLDRALSQSMGAWARGRQTSQEADKRAQQAQQAALKRAREVTGRVLAKQAMAGAKATAPGKVPMTEMVRLSEGKGKVENFRGLLDEFKDEYTNPLGTKAGEVENFLELQGGVPGRALNKLFSAHSGPQAEWWAKYKRFFELPERNELFGATLTTNEQRAWQQAEISPGMDPQAIRERLKTLHGIADKKFKEIANGIAINRNNPEAVSAVSGISTQELGFTQDEIPSGEPAGTDYESLSEEELLQLLEQ